MMPIEREAREAVDQASQNGGELEVRRITVNDEARETNARNQEAKQANPFDQARRGTIHFTDSVGAYPQDIAVGYAQKCGYLAEFINGLAWKIESVQHMLANNKSAETAAWVARDLTEMVNACRAALERYDS